MLVLASPVCRATLSPVDILNYALTLEHLEATFYRIGLTNYTADQFAAAGFDQTTYNNILEVARDEANHVDFLTSAITTAGGVPVQECTYAFPATDVPSFLGLAAVLEGVGTSAYLGAAKDIGSTPYITAAGSILTVEARHNAYLRAALKQSPFPASYDTPLAYNEVYSLAAPFFVSCPSNNPVLPLKAFPKLAALSATAAPGQQIDFGTPGTKLVPSGNDSIPLYAAWFQPTGPIFSDVIAIDNGIVPFQTTVPADIDAGQTYVVLSNCGDRVGDDTVLA